LLIKENGDTINGEKIREKWYRENEEGLRKIKKTLDNIFIRL
jgi:hypothetical protein